MTGVHDWDMANKAEELKHVMMVFSRIDEDLRDDISDLKRLVERLEQFYTEYDADFEEMVALLDDLEQEAETDWNDMEDQQRAAEEAEQLLSDEQEAVEVLHHTLSLLSNTQESLQSITVAVKDAEENIPPKQEFKQLMGEFLNMAEDRSEMSRSEVLGKK